MQPDKDSQDDRAAAGSAGDGWQDPATEGGPQPCEPVASVPLPAAKGVAARDGEPNEVDRSAAPVGERDWVLARIEAAAAAYAGLTSELPPAAADNPPVSTTDETAALVAAAAASIAERVTLLAPLAAAQPADEPARDMPSVAPAEFPASEPVLSDAAPEVPIESVSADGPPAAAPLAFAADEPPVVIVPPSAAEAEPTDAAPAVAPALLAAPVESLPATPAEPAAPLEPRIRAELPRDAWPGSDAVRRAVDLPPPPVAFEARAVRLDELAVAAENRRHIEAVAPNVPFTFESSAAPASEPVRAEAGVPRWRRRALKGLRAAAIGVAGYLAIVLVLIGLYRFVDPPGSNLMAIRWLAGNEIEQSWVPLEQISPNLVRAVIASEDDRFCVHWGIDPGAIKAAIEKAADGLPRGASTISMQVTKNMFLWPSKSFVRKAIELPLTLIMELWWPKSRVLEMYLNVAEWGPGVFGAEAAARYHFQKSAQRLSEREAALLAASLPNPIRRDAGDPGPQTSQKASIIQARMRASREPADCVLSRSSQKAN